ncbi:MAG: hypothetical protein L0Y58_16835 [Verrucomicrobia subdivision 3 bacterium]|nr:hypothetical protein [Limisphaerales bacterium]
MAVEVHQVSRTSDDLSFDLELICDLTPARIVLRATRVGDRVRISWTPGGGTLQQADDVTGRWTDVVNATNPFTLTVTEARKFYRVRL